jgi:hypothetical protein
MSKLGQVSFNPSPIRSDQTTSPSRSLGFKSECVSFLRFSLLCVVDELCLRKNGAGLENEPLCTLHSLRNLVTSGRVKH